MQANFEAITRIDEVGEKGARADVFPKGNPDLDNEGFWEGMVGVSKDLIPNEKYHAGAEFDTKITIVFDSQNDGTQRDTNEATFEAEMYVSGSHTVRGHKKIDLEVVECEKYIYDLYFPIKDLPVEIQEEGTHCYVVFSFSY